MKTVVRLRLSQNALSRGLYGSRKGAMVVQFLLLVALTLPLMVSTVFSMDRENPKRDCSLCHSLTSTEASRLLTPLGVSVKSVQHSSLRGLFEVSAERNGKSGLIFVDYGKKHVMQGVMVRVEDLVNMVGTSKNTVLEEENKATLSRLLRTNSILLGNPKALQQIVVFSDPDCPFCRKMHAELQKLVQEMDIAVYIKLFPLPAHPDAFGKSQVILGHNSIDLLNKAFSGERIPAPGSTDSREPVEETIRLAASLGIKGTPALLLPNGKIEVGYKDAATLKRLIEQSRD